MVELEHRGAGGTPGGGEPGAGAGAPGGGGQGGAVRVEGLKRTIAFAAGAVIAILYLRIVGFVVLLFLAAATLASLLLPLVRRMPGPRWLTGSAVGVSFFLGFFGAILALANFLRDGFTEVRDEWTELRQELDAVLQRITGRFGIENEIGLEELRDQLLAWLTGSDPSMLADLAGGLGATIIALALTIFGTLYFLAGRPATLRDGVIRLAPRSRTAIDSALIHAEQRLRYFCLAMIVSMIITGLLAGVGFLLIGLPFAIPLAILAALSEIVPTLGPSIVFVLALLVGAVQGPEQVALVAIVYLSVQTIESFVLVPIVIRRAVHVPPLVTMFTVVLWGRILGPLGLLLAVPLNLVIWTAVEHLYLQRRPGTVAVP